MGLATLPARAPTSYTNGMQYMKKWLALCLSFSLIWASVEPALAQIPVPPGPVSGPVFQPVGHLPYQVQLLQEMGPRIQRL